MAALSRTDRARLYRSIAQLTDAGVPVHSLVEALDRAFRGGAGALVVRRMRESARAGNPLSEAILRSEDLGFPRVHGVLLQTAEKSGQIARPLLRLAEADERAERLRRELIRRSAYPILLVHAAVLAPWAARFVSEPLATLAAAGLVLVPIDAALLLLHRAITTPRESPRLARFARTLPALDRFAHDRSAAAFLAATHALYEAGMPLLAAAVEASETVPHPDLRAGYAAASSLARDAGSSFAELLSRLPIVRPEVTGTLTIAETAGTLGEALRDTARLLEETADRDLERITGRTLRLLLAAAFVYAGYRILSFWSDYFGRIAQIR